MTDVQSLGTSPKTTASILSTAAESSIGAGSSSSYSPAASQTALIPPPPHTAAPVVARDFSNYIGARPGVIGAASTPAHPHYGAHEEKLNYQHEEAAGVNAKHAHGQASSSNTFNAAKMVRNLSGGGGGHRAKEPDHLIGHHPVAVLHVPVLTRDGRLYGWNIVLPPSDTKPLPSADRKIFFVPASEEISKENMKAIHSVENDKEGRMKLYCRKTWMLDNYVVEAKIPGTH